MKKTIVHTGKKIEVNIFGTGAHVYILLAGWTHDFQYEEKLVKTLSTSNTVITISYPGYAGSEENPKAQSAKYLSTIINTVIHQLKIKRCTLVGFSMGCQIVLHYIQDHPKQKAVLISAVMHSLLEDTPAYGKLLLSSPFLIRCIRLVTPVKRLVVNLAYAKISNVTEGRSNPVRFQSTHVTLNGAYDTLLATINSFIDPINYTNNVRFIFGDREITRKRLDEHAITYAVIQNAGHETFEKTYEQVAHLITSSTTQVGQ